MPSCAREDLCWDGVILDGRDEPSKLLSPELMALGFREVGMPNQKSFAIGGHGPGEQLFIVIGRM